MLFEYKFFCKIKRIGDIVFFLKKKNKKLEIIKNSALFDANWYKLAYPESKSNPVEHYYKIGWKKGYCPSPIFDGNKYLSTYPDVKNEDINPLLHYEIFGKKENRLISPLENLPFIYDKPTSHDVEVCKKKNKSPKISIVVTSYNYEKYITETLDSLVNQTYKNFEVIVVDDGSKDNSVNIIKEYLKKYNFIHFYQHENGCNKGIIKSMLLALSKATGEYVAFCESDDYWSLDYLEEKVKIINTFANPVIIINDIELFGNLKKCKAFADVHLNFLKSNIYTRTINNITYDDLKNRNLILTWSCVMIKNEDLLKCDFLSNPRPSAIDWWVYKQLIAKNNTIFYVNKKLTYWRMHYSFNATQTDDFDVLQEDFNKKCDAICGKPNANNSLDTNALLIKKSSYFDAEWYFSNYKISDKYKNCLEKHYLYIGWKLGFNPSSRFSNDLYLNFYRDVKLSKINPLLHYELSGKKEFRKVVSNEKLDIDVLILSPMRSFDGPFLWRAQNFKDLFLKNGIKADAESIAQPTEQILTKFYCAKLVIFQRPLFDNSCNNFIKELIRLKKKFILDIDDLLFEDYVPLFGSYKSNINSYSADSNSVYLHSDLYKFADFMSVSTSYLSHVVEEKLNKKTLILPNRISPSFCKLKKYEYSEEFKLIYTSGSRTHDYDASTMFVDLFNFMKNHNNVTLTIVGESSIESSLSMFKDRILHIPYVEMDKLFELYSKHDLLLVPLDDNLFNKAKSNIKYIEAGAVGTPVIAQDCDEFKAVIKDGVSGFLYHDSLYKKLEDIYKNKDKLYDIGKNAYQEIIENHTTDYKLPQEIKDLLC